MKELKLNTGVVIGLKAVAPLILRDATSRLKEPKVPVQHIESKGRSEENPMHPDYLAAMEEYQATRAEIVENTLLLFGTEIVSLPQGFSGPDDDGWIEAFEAVGIEISTNPKARYIQWIRLHAMGGQVEDMTIFTQELGREMGVTEEDVAVAAESFRGDEKRGSDLDTRRKKTRKNRN